MSQEECRAFRGLAARLNYMAVDNMFVQFPAKEICRNMSNPSVRDFMKVRRVVRCLNGGRGGQAVVRVADRGRGP